MPLSQKTTGSLDIANDTNPDEEEIKVPDIQSKALTTVVDPMSQSTNFYGSQDTQATSLFVTQINNLLKRGNRKRTLQQFNQFNSEDDCEEPG